jgi:acetoin utilization protein AcuA
LTPGYPQKSVIHKTEKGTLLIRSFCTPEQIEGLHFTDACREDGRYRPVVTKKERLIQAAAQEGANVTLAVQENGEIVGLSILEYPGPDERWIKVGDRVMMEVSIIEVRRAWRGIGLARNVLRLTMGHPQVESRICYMVGYSWTWDLDAYTGTAMDYRDLLIRLFSGRGFKTFQTNEPNVMMRPENLFMARVGDAVSKETVERFKLARFDLL